MINLTQIYDKFRKKHIYHKFEKHFYHKFCLSQIYENLTQIYHKFESVTSAVKNVFIAQQETHVM